MNLFIFYEFWHLRIRKIFLDETSLASAERGLDYRHSGDLWSDAVDSSKIRHAIVVGNECEEEEGIWSRIFEFHS